MNEVARPEINTRLFRKVMSHFATGVTVVTAAHEGELDVVLHVLDMERAAAGTRPQQRTHDHLGQPLDRFAHARRCRALRAMDREEGFHQRDRDLVRLEPHHRAVAADDLITGESRGRRTAGRNGARSDIAFRRDRLDSLHAFPSSN